MQNDLITLTAQLEQANNKLATLEAEQRRFETAYQEALTEEKRLLSSRAELNLLATAKLKTIAGSELLNQTKNDIQAVQGEIKALDLPLRKAAIEDHLINAARQGQEYLEVIDNGTKALLGVLAGHADVIKAIAAANAGLPIARDSFVSGLYEYESLTGQTIARFGGGDFIGNLKKQVNLRAVLRPWHGSSGEQTAHDETEGFSLPQSAQNDLWSIAVQLAQNPNFVETYDNRKPIEEVK
jgi:hypothetical protein